VQILQTFLLVSVFRTRSMRLGEAPFHTVLKYHLAFVVMLVCQLSLQMPPPIIESNATIAGNCITNFRHREQMFLSDQTFTAGLPTPPEDNGPFASVSSGGETSSPPAEGRPSAFFFPPPGVLAASGVP